MTRRAARHWLLVVAMIGVTGCGAARAPHAVTPNVASPAPAAAAAVGGAIPPANPHDDMLTTAEDRRRLAALAKARTATPAQTGYVIGPDDLLDIRIPDLIEAAPGGTARAATAATSVAGTPVFQQGVRVNASGSISLPMLGLVRAAGFTTTALEADLTRRLQAAGVLRRPEVSVQIAEYRSGVIAVIGSVERPGLYPATRPGATVADLVWAAGGPSKDAGRVVELATKSRGATAGPPIRLDLANLLQASGAAAGAANPPVRPGDVISVGPAGSVLVDGWVERPGSYPVTRGLTVSGAVAAAGGHLFAADRTRATVTRVAGGEQRAFTVDLEALGEGRGADVPLADGDVVHLPPAPARVVPWGLWTVAREMVHVGGSVLLF